MDSKFTEILDLCMKTENLVALEGCKNQSIPQLIEACQDSSTPMSVCSDSRINEFSYTFDERMDKAQQKVEALETELEELLTKKEELQKNELPYLFFVTQFDGQVIIDHRQLLRACINYALEWNEKKDVYSEETQSYLREDLSVCKARIDEIRDICEFHEMCSGIEKFDNIVSVLFPHLYI